MFAGLLREHEEAFAGHRSVRSGLKPVMNAQQCVDSQFIVEAPALMSMVHPYSISLTNHRKVTIRSLTSRSATGDQRLPAAAALMVLRKRIAIRRWRPECALE
ncbi:MAG TPA: hypothetical protein VFE92_06530 [Dermatophilaceae bacterium]|nr:hypothetical protein [Dermatophilaceae bacterium]